MIIYKATNILNNKCYIGASKYSLEQRKYGHFKDAFKKNKKTYFHKALRKYGFENFIWIVIDVSDNYQELMSKENFWVKFYNSFGKNGYNSCEGGGNTAGYKFSEESKKKMSEKAKLNAKNKPNPFKGKTHSQKQKEKWSKERKDRKLNGEWLENIRLARKKLCKPVINLDTGEIFNSIGEAQERYNLKNGIANVCRGKKKTAAGQRWEFYNNQS